METPPSTFVSIQQQQESIVVSSIGPAGAGSGDPGVRTNAFTRTSWLGGEGSVERTTLPPGGRTLGLLPI